MAETRAYRRTRVGQVRLVIAWLCTIGAVAYCTLGLVNPAWVGLAGNRGIVYMTAPALLLAATAHLYLITVGTRLPTDEMVPGEDTNNEAGGDKPSAKLRKV